MTTSQLLADEGMWVYNNLPREQLKKKYNFDPTEKWADHLMKSSVRFNSGGSGSFVSSTGLVLTNHHVAADTLYKLSTPEHDLNHDGFLAKDQADERRAVDLELNVLMEIEDVTARVNGAVKEGVSPAEAFAARRAVMAEIEKESLDKTGLRSDVVTLYQGGQYHLYRYKKYTDVRLVFAPEFEIAFFGGDPDNFEFPRYNLDMCLFRVYENDKPAKIEHFLAWSDQPLKEDELVFVSGHPGRTSRLFTVAALEFLRDQRIPLSLDVLRRREVLLQQYGYGGEEQTRRAKDEYFGIQNSRKAYTGMIQGLQDPAFFAKRQADESALREKVAKDPKLAKVSDAWDKIAKAQGTYAQINRRRAMLELGMGLRSDLFTLARTLVRMAEEDQKPSAERLREFRDSNRESLEQQLFSEAPIYEDLELALLADSLGLMVEQLGAGDPLVVEILAGKSPQARAAELISGTKLKDVAERRRLHKEGAAGIKGSKDPMILLAVLVDPEARALRKQYEENVQEAEEQAYSQIAEALFALEGTTRYPDATFTLRLAFGQVKGYEENGKQIKPWTTLGGAFEHEQAHGAKSPWVLPKRWHERKAEIKLDTQFNFVCTADIIGGNSGSPVVNREGQLVGLIFDGNIQSLTADYMFTDVQGRAVSVAAVGIMESLRAVYQADKLADELGK